MAIIVSFLPREGKFKYEFQKGKPWKHNDLIAPFDFAILKSDEQYNAEVSNTLMSFRPYFSLNTEITTKQRTELINLLTNSGSMLSAAERDQALSLSLKIFDSIMTAGLINPAALSKSYPSYQEIILVRNKLASESNINKLFNQQSAVEFANKQLQLHEEVDKKLILSCISASLKANAVEETLKNEQLRQELISSVSKWHGLVQQGERIISKGELITAENYQLLLSLKDEYESQLGNISTYYAILSGQIILVIISMVAIGLFLFSFRKDLFANNKKLILILFQIVLMVIITSLVIKIDLGYLYLVPLCIVPIIIRSFFDTRLALFVHVISIINVGFLVPNSFEFVFMQLFTGIITIISVVKLYKRSQFFITSVYIFITYSTIYIGLTLVHEGNFSSISYTNFILFAGSALLTLFANPLIYIYERIFGLMTDVSLMEYSDTNNTLLRELANRAPGTFQHSIQVANLAEEAVLAIKGNPMLARAGALYHDIGKMDMPAYFIENQTGGFNPHEELSSEESARLIISHVIKGVEKAKRFKIPEQIIDFIRTHHGTKRVDYFYALQKKETPDEMPDEQAFSYRGPIPFSKETCVVMMADAVEAATRSLKNPGERKIAEMVDTIIDKHFAEAQFMNANITLRDISVVKKLFKKRLLNIYHLRIEYPE